jgi:NADH:ubiquinone oxidoreductase subunit 3 (subunit A)
MISKTITSLAILKVNWDKFRKDYIENFIPFIIHLLNNKNYDKIIINKITADFEEEYGIKLPYHPAITILNRARKRGYIKRVNNEYYPIKEKIIKDDLTSTSNKQKRKINQILHEFIEYSESNYKVSISLEKAEEILISYLKDYDLDILFASYEETMLPNIKISKSNKFLFNRFIREIFEKNQTLFDYLVDISIGHILANTILYDEFNRYLGKLSGNKYYLDSNIIFELIGTHGQDRKNIYEDFIQTLQESGVKLHIFGHTYEELMANLNSCLKWIDNPNFDAQKAGKTLNYFIINGYTQSDIDRFISNVPLILNRFNIEIIKKPNYMETREYQIDELKLKELLINTYKKYDESFNENEKDFVIRNDIDSLSSVFKLRKGAKPRLFQDAKHIFVTRNSTLAYVSSLYEKEISEGFTINTCLTDTFIGTLIWLQSPAKIYDINVKKIIADTYAALQPDTYLVKRYLNEIQRLKENKNITTEEYYILRSHRAALNLLEEKTLGDPENFSDSTPEEILMDIKRKFEYEGNTKYKQEKEKHQQTQLKLNFARNNLNKFDNSLMKISDKFSRFISWFLFSAALIILIAVTIMQFYPQALIQSNLGRIIILLLVTFLTILNIGFGVNFRGIRENFNFKIYKFLITILRKHLSV